jgi:hypothetical protein
MNRATSDSKICELEGRLRSAIIVSELREKVILDLRATIRELRAATASKDATIRQLMQQLDESEFALKCVLQS